MIRFEVRCPPLPPRTPRSGAIILDLHGTRLSSGTQLERKPTTAFAGADSPSSPHSPLFCAQESLRRHALLTAACQRLVIAVSPLGQRTANMVLSLGSLSSTEEVIQEVGSFGAIASPPVTLPDPPSSIRIFISQSESTISSQRPTPSNTVAVTIDVPSVHADISKLLLDSLQLWADDVSQLVEHAAAGDTDTEKAESRNPSLIGSRFFAKTRRHGSEESSSGFSGTRAEVGNETVIKIVLSEGLSVQCV